MDEQYFYVVDSQRGGPRSFASLRELAAKGELKRSAKVWCRGLKNWERADSVPRLFDELPPDLDSAAPPHTPPPIPTGDVNPGCNSCDLGDRTSCIIPNGAAGDFMKKQRQIFIAGFPIGFFLLIAAAFFSAEGSEADDFGIAICTLLGAVALVMAVVNWLLMHYRLWKLLPVTLAETTPGRAVGFYFIPLFNVYWCFVTFKGLAASANKTLIAFGQDGFRCNEGLATAFSVAAACSLSLGCMIPVVGTLATIAAYVLWIVWYRDLAKAFVVIECHARQSGPPTSPESQFAIG